MNSVNRSYARSTADFGHCCRLHTEPVGTSTHPTSAPGPVATCHRCPVQQPHHQHRDRDRRSSLSQFSYICVLLNLRSHHTTNKDRRNRIDGGEEPLSWTPLQTWTQHSDHAPLPRPAAPLWRLANEASARRGRASPSGPAGDHRRQAWSSVVLAGRALDVP